jgi:hypothetical protein
MDKETKKKIKNMVLTLREMFENEIENRLNYYGIYRDKAWKDGRSLRYLSSEELSNKKRVEAFIKRQESAGLSQSQAAVEFIKEASYTSINRLIGLKCMETQGLIDEEVITVREEFGGRSKRHRNFVVMEHPELANTPDGGLIQCLMDVFREVTEEIKILFDPENEYSLIVPRYRCLKDAIDLINKSVDYDVYKEDELLGWIYQYFQEIEKRKFKSSQKTKKTKADASDIPVITSLYTPYWIVKYLVNNSLGALWVEMHPGSNLGKDLNLKFTENHRFDRPEKEIKSIKFLDPACGSGHFFLYAFDLFYQMYKEEGVVPEEDIPNYILKYNLHGIDIDLRSVQISALSLWMKAKSKNRDIKIEQMNLVAANAIMLDDDILDEFLDEFGGDVLAKELVTTIWNGLQNVRELGSLLKIEEQIDEVIERVKGQTRVGELWDKEQFTWERWKQRIMDKLKSYYEKAAETVDINKQMFANETIKGLSFIDLISQKYDVVATNPPYIDKRDYSLQIKDYLKTYYPNSERNTFSAFIEVSCNLVSENGKIGMITPQSFMFIKKFSKLRKTLLEYFFLEKFVQLGYGALDDAYVDTVIFVLQEGFDKSNKSIFYRLIDDEDKEEALNKIITDVVSNLTHKKVELFQEELKIIRDYPFVYWPSSRIRNIFKNEPPLDKFAEIKQGLATGDNDKFLRFFWEVKSFGGQNKWKGYAKGGAYDRWATTHDLVINWTQKAREEYKKTQFAQVFVSRRATEYLNRESITYTLTSRKGFSTRLLDKEFITDVAGSSIFTSKSELYYVLAFSNSGFSRYVLDILNPTVSFQVGDLKRIPFKLPNTKTKKNVSELAENCVMMKKSLLHFVINDREFKQPALMWGWENIKGSDVK